MNRGIRNWMIVSVALALAETGQLLGGQFHLWLAEQILDATAILLGMVVVIRYFSSR